MKNRQILVLCWFFAPIGALVIAAVVGYFVFSGQEGLDNRCYVDSYDVESGIILVQQDLNDKDVGYRNLAP